MSRKRIKVGIVIDEYFGGAGTPFGGDGVLARHVVARYVPDDSIQLHILLCKRSRPWHVFSARTTVGGVPVYNPPSRFWLSAWLLWKSYDVYLTIELTHDILAYDLRPWKRI